MVPRYARPDMVAIWDAENRFKIWFEIEAHATEALADLGVVPKAAADALWAWWATNPAIDVAAIDAIEAVTKHDVIAFLTWVAEQVGDEARFMHQGMTSSDVLDTCLAVQLARASDLLLADLDALLAAIKRRAFEHKLTPCIGRSHGIHAEPVTFGLKMAEAYAEFSRCKERLLAARRDVATCAISGAVGTFANIDPRVEEHVAARLGLSVEPVSTQVIPRDRHAMFFATLGVIASSIERLAVEIRHLQRTEVLEAEEYFSPGQKGSVGHAAQAQSGADRKPHRPCPHGAQLCHSRRWRMSRCGTNAISAIARSSAISAPMRRSRSISRSVRLTGVVDKLLVYPERMQKNLDKMGGLVHSQRVLLALTQAGVSREDSYVLVQRNAMKVWESDGQLSLLELLKADADVTRALSPQEIEEKFDLGYHLKHVDTIFARVFGS
jgi:adenylosuccinate lyase